MRIEPQQLPPRLRERVIEQGIFQHALSVARTMRDARTVAEQADELQAIAAIGLQAAEEAIGQPEPARAANQDGIAQTAAVQALAAACGATVLALRAQALREGDAQAQRFLDRTRPLLPRPLGTEPQAAPDTPASSDDGDDLTRADEPGRRHLDFGHIDENQDPDTIAREVEAVYEQHGL